VAIRDEAFYNLAVTYTVQNKLDDALKTIRALTAVSKLGDSVEQARMLAGQIYLQQGNLLGAANEFRSFKKSYPNSALVATIDMLLPEIEKKLASSGK
jgi:predicted Zn-dependent protease